MSRFVPGHYLWIAAFSNEDKGNLIVEKIIHRLSSSHEPFFFSCGFQYNLVYIATTLFPPGVLLCAASYRT